MINKLFGNLAKVEQYELMFLLSSGVLTKSVGNATEEFKCDKVKSFKFAVDYYEGSVYWDLINFNKILNLIRQDMIESVKSKLVGMELKRGCQYDREWIADIRYLGDQTFVVSSTGHSYGATNVKVYDTETTATPLFNFAAMLIVTDVEEDGCQSCTG